MSRDHMIRPSDAIYTIFVENMRNKATSSRWDQNEPQQSQTTNKGLGSLSLT